MRRLRRPGATLSSSDALSSSSLSAAHERARVHQLFTISGDASRDIGNRSQRISHGDSRKNPVLASDDETQGR